MLAIKLRMDRDLLLCSEGGGDLLRPREERVGVRGQWPNSTPKAAKRVDDVESMLFSIL